MLLFCVALSIPFGVWAIANSRLPSWMKGVWKWPLGGDLSPTVARLYGWANVIVGLDSLVLAVLVIVLPQVPDNVAQARPVIVAALSAIVGALGVGCYFYARSVLLSRGQPT